MKASVTLPGLLRQNPKMNMDKGALVRAVGTGPKQPAIHRFPFENQPMTIRTTAAITVVGDIPVCTRACHGVAEAGENAGRSAGTNAGTNAEKASEKASVKTSVKTSMKRLQAILEDAEITIPDLATLVGVTTRSVERNIRKLQEEQKLRRIGPDKGGRWEVLK